MSDSVRERLRLAGASTRDYQQRARCSTAAQPKPDSGALCGIKFAEMGCRFFGFVRPAKHDEHPLDNLARRKIRRVMSEALATLPYDTGPISGQTNHLREGSSFSRSISTPENGL
jgi:hypothetical protein